MNVFKYIQIYRTNLIRIGQKEKREKLKYMPSHDIVDRITFISAGHK